MHTEKISKVRDLNFQQFNVKLILHSKYQKRALTFIIDFNQFIKKHYYEKIGPHFVAFLVKGNRIEKESVSIIQGMR